MINKFIIYIIFLHFFTSFSKILIEDFSWAQVYKSIYDDYQMEENGKKTEIIFALKTIFPFDQLILSFNAFRPSSDFTFFIRSKNSNGWQKWHKAFVWGENQKSFFDRSSDSVYNYAHLDIENGNLGVAFQVKITCENSSDLSLIRAVFCTTSLNSSFKKENNFDLNSRSVLVRNVPLISQFLVNHKRADSICAPTSLSMVCSYLNDCQVDVSNFAAKVLDSGLNIYGNWIFNVAHAFSMCDGNFLFYPARLNGFKEIYDDMLSKKIPAIVSIRGPIEGSKMPYANGHILVIVGYNSIAKRILCHDPAISKSNNHVFISYDFFDFMTAWQRSKYMTYKIERISP